MFVPERPKNQQKHSKNYTNIEDLYCVCNVIIIVVALHIGIVRNKIIVYAYGFSFFVERTESDLLYSNLDKTFWQWIEFRGKGCTSKHPLNNPVHPGYQNVKI